jgi:hypothetical protein
VAPAISKAKKAAEASAGDEASEQEA